MKVVQNKLGFTSIEPESDEYVIYSLERNTYHKKIYIGPNDSVDNYKQVEKSLVEEADAKATNNDLVRRIEEQENTIAKLSKQVEDLINLINKNK